MSRHSQIPTIEVVGVSPVLGSEIDINKVRANVLTAGPDPFSHAKTPDFFQAMIQRIPFVSPSAQSGDPFQINLDYRGFTASLVHAAGNRRLSERCAHQ
jgi:iron complex outermembrane recepter protein